jgi:F0F1-type ATP synthase membrane subunit b/b'
MSDASLRQYEGDVEIARAKLNASLDTLRSPETLSTFSDDLKKEAREAKDALVDQAKSAAQSQLNKFVEEVKAKAANNPAAALAIGAGLAWHFLRHPPIAAALIGLGAFSLWRTNAGSVRGYSPDYLELGKQRLKEQASEAAERVKDAAAEGRDRLSEKIGEFTTAAHEKVEDWTDEVKNTVGDLSATLRSDTPSIVPGEQDAFEPGPTKTAADELSGAPSEVRHFAGEQDSRDKLLLGLAGAAVAAALGIACQRRLSDS